MNTFNEQSGLGRQPGGFLQPRTLSSTPGWSGYSFRGQQERTDFARVTYLPVASSSNSSGNASEAPHQEPSDVLSAYFSDQIASLIRAGRGREASKILEAVLATGLSTGRLEFVRRLLQVTVTPGAEPSPTRLDSAPMKFDPAEFKGLWVALRGASVVDSAPKLDELRGRLKPGERLTLHWVPE